MTDHPGDILVNATVEALTQQKKDRWDQAKQQGKDRTFIYYIIFVINNSLWIKENYHSIL